MSDVRDGTEADLPAVAAIYTHYVLNTSTTFNTRVRTPAEWRERYVAHVVEGPHHLVVAERAGRVVGWCESQPFRDKPAYAATAEWSVYVAPDGTGRGTGGAMLELLRQRLVAGGFHRLLGVVALPNPASVTFHRQHGFVHRGTLTEAGRKFGQWHDVALLELPLA